MKTVQEIIEEKMCCGCGACASVCPTNCIEFIQGKYVNYPSVNIDKCINCSLCLRICPGRKNKERLLEANKIKLEDEIVRNLVSYSTDDNIRIDSASGGVITTIAIELLRNNYIDSVVTISGNEKNALLNDVNIVKTIDEIIKSQGSRYSPSSNCLSINEIIKNEKYKKVLFIGKPCDIEAVNEYEKINKRFKEKIALKLSIMCHHSPTRKALIKLINDNDLNKDDIKTIKFRGGGWPGYFKIEGNNNEVLRKTYFDAWGNYLSRDENVKCMYCENPFPKEADIIVGDPWGEEYKNERKGKSLLIIRSERGNSFIKELEQNEKLISNEVTYDDVKRYQKNLLKRYDEFYLIALLYKRIHGYKINNNDYRNVLKENPKNILRYFKNLNKYKVIYKEWKYE